MEAGWKTTPPLPETVALIARMLGWKGPGGGASDNVGELIGVFGVGKVHDFAEAKRKRG